MTVQELKELASPAIAGLEPLADTIKDSAMHLYAIQVKQVLVMGISYLIGDIVLLLCIIGLYRATNSIMAKEHPDDFVVIVLGNLWFVALLLSVTAIMAFPDVLSYLIVPEYKAIQLTRDLISTP